MATQITSCSKYTSDTDRCILPMRTLSSCKYHYHKDKYGKKTYLIPTKNEVHKMIDMYKSGKSASEVAKYFGYSKTTILRRVRAAGIVRSDELSKGTKYLYGADYIPKTPWLRSVLSSLKYKAFRKRMFERDLWSCQSCNYTGSKIQLDHIKPRCLFPELIFDESNVRTLCISCHKKTDTYGGGSANKTRGDFK